MSMSHISVVKSWLIFLSEKFHVEVVQGCSWNWCQYRQAKWTIASMCCSLVFTKLEEVLRTRKRGRSEHFHRGWWKPPASWLPSSLIWERPSLLHYLNAGPWSRSFLLPPHFHIPLLGNPALLYALAIVSCLLLLHMCLACLPNLIVLGGTYFVPRVLYTSSTSLGIQIKRWGVGSIYFPGRKNHIFFLLIEKIRRAEEQQQVAFYEHVQSQVLYRRAHILTSKIKQ